MIPLFNNKQFDDAKSTDMLPLKCEECNNTYSKPKKDISRCIRGLKNINFCSVSCSNTNRGRPLQIPCANCDTIVTKKPSDIQKSKTGNIFCSKSCAATFNNKNKTHGTRRSKLESWLENELIKLYPNLEIHFNQKDAIGSELDIYIPSLNIAFELNGIFHYEPIFGVDKLEQIQENDQSKTKACIDAKIDLCIIDTSQQKYVKPKTSQKYLDIIINIVNERLLTS